MYFHRDTIELNIDFEVIYGYKVDFHDRRVIENRAKVKNVSGLMEDSHSIDE